MRPFLRLVGNNVPTVDILIPCCGENLEVIRDTIRAACTLDYPRERYRVVLLDDGNSMELQHEVDVLKKAHPRNRNLFYTCRGVKVVTHSKVANLNHGLSFVEDLGPAEYIAVLDVDMIPLPSFLRALLPHLLNDPSTAMSSLPQSFYNIPDGDPLCQGLDRVSNIYLLNQDTSGNAMCTGTGFVLRRSAVEEMGGIPLEEMNEDFMTSLILQANGWKVNEDMMTYLFSALMARRSPMCGSHSNGDLFLIALLDMLRKQQDGNSVSRLWCLLSGAHD